MTILKQYAYAGLFTFILMLAYSLVNDKPQASTEHMAMCIPDNAQTEVRITLSEHGTPFITKHEKLTDAEQRAYLNKIWPMLSAEWNSKK